MIMAAHLMMPRGPAASSMHPRGGGVADALYNTLSCHTPRVQCACVDGPRPCVIAPQMAMCSLSLSSLHPETA